MAYFTPVAFLYNGSNTFNNSEKQTMNSDSISNTYQPEIYKLLSDCFLLPDATLEDSIVSLEYLVEKIYPQFTSEARQMLETFKQIDDIEELQVEFTRLFIGPYAMLAPPYESVYRSEEGTLMGRSTLNILELYKKSGFDLVGDYHDAPDHITTELEFLYVLSIKVAVSRMYDEPDRKEPYDELLKSLLIDHLNHWVPALTSHMKQKTESDFYKALATLTRNVIFESVSQLA